MGYIMNAQKIFQKIKTYYENIDYEDSLKHSFKYNFIRMMRKQNLKKQ